MYPEFIYTQNGFNGLNLNTVFKDSRSQRFFGERFEKSACGQRHMCMDPHADSAFLFVLRNPSDFLE